MKVILLESVTGVGETGELKNVSDGFALNYLFPKNLATRATSEKVAELKTLAEKLLKTQEEKKKAIKDIMLLFQNLALKKAIKYPVYVLVYLQ